MLKRELLHKSTSGFIGIAIGERPPGGMTLTCRLVQSVVVHFLGLSMKMAQYIWS